MGSLTSTDNIATFVEVVRQKSLSAAARRLSLPKSTVSRRLVRLEQELATQLLHRDARKVALTAAGRRFYESVAAPVDALDAAVLSLAQNTSEPRGGIRVTAPPDLGRMLLAPMFVAFLEQHPEIELDLVLTNQVVDLVQEGVDLAVRAVRQLDGQLIARKLCPAELQLAARAGTVLEDDPRTLLQRPFVLHGRTRTLKLERTGRARRVLEVHASGRLMVDDYATMAELVAAGAGLGLMPALHVREGERTGKLTRVLHDWSARAGHVYMVYPSRRLPERVRLLHDFLLAAFAKLGCV
ncbi:MAG TPA: LysR substrate-binding domain-containing protein [Polyangiales bacterium]